jgi:hypothetical protein
MLNEDFEDEFDVFNYFPISKAKEHRDASDSGYHIHIPQSCLIAFRPRQYVHLIDLRPERLQRCFRKIILFLERANKFIDLLLNTLNHVKSQTSFNNVIFIIG